MLNDTKKTTAMVDIFCGVKNLIEFDPTKRNYYEKIVVSRDTLLDIGGRNSTSKSRKRIDLLKGNIENKIVSTDIYEDYGPDLIDDICHTKISQNSFEGIYCDAILEHVQQYQLAIDNIYKILVKGGEAFIFVPFFWPFHDRTDFHRFTFTELARIIERFDEKKILLPGRSSGFGYVVWFVLTYGMITKFPKIHSFLSIFTNCILGGFLFLYYHIKRKHKGVTFKEFNFFYVYLVYNYGFCAYVKK